MSGDYISREQAVENAIDQMRVSKSEECMRERLLNIEPADVVPVVRCKDCKYDRHCFTQSFVESEGIIPFDRNLFYCADGAKMEGSE